MITQPTGNVKQNMAESGGHDPHPPKADKMCIRHFPNLWDSLSNHKFIIAFVWFLGFLIWDSLLPSPAFAANSGIFTVSLWVKPTSTIASQALVGKAEELRVFTDASGYAGCQIKSTTWQTASTGTTAITLNSWNHVACTYDKATLKIYVNGVLANSNTLTSTIDDTANALLLGQDSSASTPYSNLTGTTDDFKFYNYARTQKQIIEDMGGGHPAVLASSLLSSSGLTGGSRAGGPVAYWKFDEGQGTTANNSGSGGSTLNGTLTGMASPATSTSGWTQAGKFNRALNFDGGNDYVSVPNSSSLSGTTKAISFWVYFNSYPNQYPVIIEKGYYIQSLRAAEYPNNGWYLSGVSGGYFGDSTTRIPLNQWTHYAFVSDGTTMSLYMNGVLKATAAGSFTPNSSTMSIGTYTASTGYNIDGKLDEVKIYPYALTADEVKLDYNKGSAQVLGALSDNSSSSFTSSSSVQGADHEYCIPGDATSCASPVGRWDFDEGAGTSVKDVSGNGYNGTITGATYKVGKIGKALNFNGSSDVIDTISSVSGIKTISFWVNPSTTTQNLIDLQTTPGTINVSVSGGALSATGFTSPTYYINGIQTTSPTLTANNWSHVEITTGTAITGSAIRFGRISTTSLTGKLDHIRFFNYARSGAQAAWDYNRGAPVGHWKFDECQGDTAHDSSGNSNHGTITVTSTLGKCSTASTFWGGSGGTGAGKFNYAPTFNGTGDYVSAANESNFDFERTNAFTIGAWVKTSSNNTQMIFAKMANTDPYTGFDFHILSTGVPRFLLINTYTASTIDTKATKAVNDGSWHQVTVTYDGSSSASGVNFYIDGILASKTTTTDNLSTSILNNVSPTIGTRNNQAYYFNGQLDDVRVYNYALTPLQVKLLSNQGAAVRYGPFLGAP